MVTESDKLKETVIELQRELSSLREEMHRAKSNAYKSGITRETLTRYLNQGLSVNEIAEKCGVAPNTIRNRLREYHLNVQ